MEEIDNILSFSPKEKEIMMSESEYRATVLELLEQMVDELKEIKNELAYIRQM